MMDTTLVSTLRDTAVDVLMFPALAIALVVLVMLVLYAWHLHKRGF